MPTEPTKPEEDAVVIPADRLDKFGYETAEGLSIAPSDDPDAEEFDLS